MKLLKLLFLLLLFNSCSKKVPNYFIPEEYDYPANKIGDGKIFVYRNGNTKENISKSLKLVRINGEDYRNLVDYDSTSIRDSLLILKGQIVENYNYFMAADHSIVKGQIIQDTIIYTGDKLGTNISKCVYNTSSDIYKTTSVIKYLKDTSINWQNENLPCLVLLDSSKIEIEPKAAVLPKHAINVEAKLFYAKNLGLYKYTISFINKEGIEENNSFTLISIKNVDKH